MMFRTITLALAVAAIAAPAATAQPADMHASVAQAASAAQQRQDLRSPDAVDAARNPRIAVKVETQSRGVPAPVAPTWPTNPKPITPAHAVESPGSDDGVDWTTIGLGIAGALLALGGIVALTNRARGVPRPRASV